MRCICRDKVRQAKEEINADERGKCPSDDRSAGIKSGQAKTADATTIFQATAGMRSPAQNRIERSRQGVGDEYCEQECDHGLPLVMPIYDLAGARLHTASITR